MAFNFIILPHGFEESISQNENAAASSFADAAVSQLHAGPPVSTPPVRFPTPPSLSRIRGLQRKYPRIQRIVKTKRWIIYTKNTLHTHYICPYWVGRGFIRMYGWLIWSDLCCLI